MSSRFVPAGAAPAETASDTTKAEDESWARARKEVETLRAEKPINPGQQEGGKSLYETLQANKAAKQEEFEQASRLKNQIRALDDSEVEFLDSIAAQNRAKEAAEKRETSEQLEAFRKQRSAAEKAGPVGVKLPESDVDVDAWAATKKRRRREQDASSDATVKIRKTSTDEESRLTGTERPKISIKEAKIQQEEGGRNITKPPTSEPVTLSSGLGLDAYSSEED